MFHSVSKYFCKSIVCLFLTDPAQVIGLYPELLPIDFKKHLVYPSSTPSLHGSVLEKGILSLIKYLTEVCLVDSGYLASQIEISIEF